MVRDHAQRGGVARRAPRPGLEASNRRRVPDLVVSGNTQVAETKTKAERVEKLRARLAAKL